jgi:uncharacterized protein YciI
MMFCIYRIDRRDRPGGRDQHRQAHLDYLNGFASAVLVAGPLWSTEDETVDGPRLEIGSMYLTNFDTEQEAVAFAFNDPFHVAGLFERVEVRGFTARVGTKSEALRTEP